MLRNILLVISMFVFGLANAQNKPLATDVVPQPTVTVETVPSAYTNLKINSLRTWTPLIPFTDASDVSISSKTNTEIRQQTSYFDRMGRNIQEVKRGVTPLGKDIVEANFYSANGKENIMYLPYPSTQYTGGLRTNPFAEQKAFYSNPVVNENRFIDEKVYYAKNEFENSPLNRALKEMPAGNSWAGSDRGTSTSYLVNTASEQIVIWSVDNASGSMPVANGYYSDGKLTKTVATDAGGKRSIVYKDLEGNIIVRKEEVASGDAVYGGWLTTYFVYDDFNNVRYVVPPMAVEALIGNWTFTGKQALIDELCFYYEYDAFSRKIVEKIPGAAPVEMVYDNRDRLVFSRNGRQKDKGLWRLIGYDQLNRSVMEGFYKSNKTRATLQSELDAAPATGTLSVSHTFSSVADLVVTTRDNYIREYVAVNTITFDPEFDSDGTEFETRLDPNLTIVNTTYQLSIYNPLPSLSSGDIIPLSYNYYDNYGWTGSKTFRSADIAKPEQGDNPQKDDIVKSDITAGYLTGSRVRVLGSDQWLSSTNYYDAEGRTIQVLKDNISGGEDVVTNLYDFNDKLLSSYLRHTAPGNATTPLTTILSINNFDHAGRIKSSVIRLNDTPGLERTISDNTYYETGELKSTNLGGLRDVVYDYSITGNLKSINKDYVDGTDIGSFGEELFFDHGFTINQFGGEIAGVVWRGDGPARAYGYEYDPSGRMTKADFTQKDGGSWLQGDVNYSVYGPAANGGKISYDANGNIKAYNQKGLKGTTSDDIDILSYVYGTNSNKLTSVTDQKNDPTSQLGDFKEITSGQAVDYLYDVNGNLIKDENKGISQVSYNELDLPEQIVIPGKGTIRFQYDATGGKLQKFVTDQTGSAVKERKFVYDEGLVYEDNVLKYISHGEGRVRLVQKPSQPIAYYFDYFINDHLGSTRVVYTDQSDLNVYQASMEMKSSAKENSLFSNVDASRSVKPVGYPDTDSSNKHTAKLNAKFKDKRIGPSLVLKVMAGDTIRMRVNAFYKSQGPQQKRSADPVPDMLTPLIQAFAPGGVGTGAKGVEPVSSNLPFNQSFTSNDYKRLKEKEKDANLTNRPKAYLNYVLFDEQMKMVEENSGVKQVQATEDQIQVLGNNSMRVSRNGYLYVYTSNESQQDVYFDDLMVIMSTGNLLEETHYYPFGLTMDGISSTAITAAGYPENQIKYSGKELQKKEFSDGAGLEWYDYGARMYDPQVNRWHVIDGASKDYLSLTPYGFCANNPVKNKDVDGNRFFPQALPWPSINVEAMVQANASRVVLQHAWENNTEEGRQYRLTRAFVQQVQAYNEAGLYLVRSSTPSSNAMSGKSTGMKMFHGITGGLVGAVPLLGSSVRFINAAREGDKKGMLFNATFAFVEGAAVVGGLKTVGASGGNGAHSLSSGSTNSNKGVQIFSNNTSSIKSGYTNPQLVQEAATRAEAKIGGVGKLAGIDKHEYATKLLVRHQNIYGYKGLDTKVYFNKGINDRGFLDVLDSKNGIIYDWKFGYPGKTPAQLNNTPQMLKYQRNFNFPTQIIKP